MDEIRMYFGVNRCIRFDEFVPDQIAPRVPDGFTILDGVGQWRNQNGRIFCEPCKIVILIVESWQNAIVQNNVYAIRNQYCAYFNQESVLVTVSGLHEVSF